MEKVGMRLPCPHPECREWMRISDDVIRQIPTWGWCICKQTRIAVLRGDDGTPLLAQLADRPLRKGDAVLARHTYVSLDCDDAGQWHSVETLTRGGKRPLGANGSPIEPRDIVGVIEWPGR